MCIFKIENGNLVIRTDLFSASFPGVESADETMEDAGGLSLPFHNITAQGQDTIRHYHVWEDLPVVYMPDYSENILHKLTGEHWLIRSVKLHALTDENDTLTEENEYHLYSGRVILPMTGEMFFLENPEDGKAMVIISEAPDYQTTTLRIRSHEITIDNGGNPVALGFCQIGGCEALARAYYRHACKSSLLVAMSNTWGDRNGFSRVCHDFVLREVDAAKELGVDIVQIDDGWQSGSTSDPAIYDEQRHRHFGDSFWQIHTERFPEGLGAITNYAEPDGIRVGMWFAPDSNDCFAKLERDKAVLRKAYEEWGIRFFKLDMYRVLDTAYRDRFLELLKEIYSFGNDVSVQLDTTRDERINYLCGRQYGTIFVENRYHKWANAFPHRVLRNLWSLSHYLPAQKFQFEVINPDLWQENYRPGDPFIPSLYDMDYQFAAVMLSNPLFWMEMQFLGSNRKEELKRIMPVWKQHRHILSESDVIPMGQKPTGRSFTGFQVQTGGKTKYLLLFREATEQAEATLCAGVTSGNIKILASNTETELNLMNGAVHVKLSKPRSYVFAEIQ